MALIFVPYHHDERLSEQAIPLPARSAPVTVTARLPAADIWQRLASLDESVAQAVTSQIQAGAKPTVISGDCLVALGVLAGVQRAGVDPSIVWFDAHGDVHTLATSTSGYLGGLALRLVLGASRTRCPPTGLAPAA